MSFKSLLYNKFSLLFLLGLGSILTVSSSYAIALANPHSNHLTLAKQPQSLANTPNFIENLLTLNQSYQHLEKSLNQSVIDLEKGFRQPSTINAESLKTASDILIQIQQQLTTLKQQVNLLEPEQQTAAQVDLTKLDQLATDTLKLTAPLKSGLSQANVKAVQKFLGFFQQKKLAPTDYGFYGPKTQGEVERFVSGQLQAFSEVLTTLNQTASKAAIAPDLATSQSYLYTYYNLNSVPNTDQSTQDQIVQLQQENDRLYRELQNSRIIALVWPLILSFPIMGLVLMLFYYFARIMQQKYQRNQAYQLTNNDFQSLEEELFARLQAEFDLTPKFGDRPLDQFTDQSINFADIDNTKFPENTEEDAQFNRGTRPKKAIATAPKPIPETSDDDEPLLLDNDEGKLLEGDDTGGGVYISNSYDALVETYNNNVADLATTAIAVMISHQETFLDEEDQFTPILILSQNPDGNYWIVTLKKQYFLIPKANLSINDNLYPELKNLFTCYGHQKGSTQKAKLLKPARVSPTEDPDTWELVQQGIVALHQS